MRVNIKTMVKFNTLNTLISDIQTEITNNNIAESNTISTKQIELWIHQYRSLLLKQDIDKKRYVNPTYIQEVNGLQLQSVDFGAPAGLNTSVYRTKSVSEIPDTVDFHFKSGITSITDVFGNEIQLLPEHRARQQKNKKWSHNEYVAYLKQGSIYVEGPNQLEYINIRGIFEVPPAVNEVDVYGDINYFDYDAQYPLPSDKVIALKSMIFQNEFGIMLSVGVDDSNNSDNDTELTKNEVGVKKK